MKTATLTEFLLERISEDEAVAQAAVGHRFSCRVAWSDTEVITHIGRWSSRRVLAECEAKRRVVALHRPSGTASNFCHHCAYTNHEVWPCPDIRIMAAVYVDHADYDESWRP